MTGARVVAAAGVYAIVAGIGIDVLTFLVARYGPAADGWSLRGNGALVVPFGLGPALIAAGWSATVLHYREAARWILLAAAAGTIGFALALASVLVLALYGSAVAAASYLAILLGLIWMLAAPVVAAVLPVSHLGGGRKEAPYGVALVLVLLLTPVSLFVSSIVLPPGS
jgi:hypothetical protein